MTHRHRDERSKLDQRLETEWDGEVRARAARLPTGLRGIWARITGQYRRTRAELEAEAERSRARQMQARQTLVDQQLVERGALQDHVKGLRQRQARELTELRREIGRYLQLARAPSREPTPTEAPELERQKKRLRREM